MRLYDFYYGYLNERNRLEKERRLEEVREKERIIQVQKEKE
jgi:hypothetical protein